MAKLGAYDDVLRVTARSWSPATGDTSGPGRIGLESERFVVGVDAAGRPLRRLPLDAYASVLDAVAVREAPPGVAWRLADGSRLVPEPGGQIEHATRPAAHAADVLAAERRAASHLGAALSGHGAVLVACGLDRWHPPAAIAQQLPGPRYPAMAAYFRLRAPHGHVMMCHSCSLQLNLDAGGGAAALERWRLVHLIAPVTAATFSTSPLPGAANARTLAWLGLDPTRTGIPHAFVEGVDDPVAVLADAALRADVLLVGRDGGQPGLPGWTFGTWLAEGHPEHGRPTEDDLQRHLTTLFHEVRVRRFLEIRGIDALPARWRAVPVVLYAGLLYDAHARDAAGAVLERHRPRLPELLLRAAHVGLADPELCATAVEVWSLAVEGAHRLPAGYVDPADVARAESFLDRFTLRGRSPGDELRALDVEGPHASLAWATEPSGTLLGATGVHAGR